jgi:hypothetical protein
MTDLDLVGFALAACGSFMASLSASGFSSSPGCATEQCPDKHL